MTGDRLHDVGVYRYTQGIHNQTPTPVEGIRRRGLEGVPLSAPHIEAHGRLRRCLILDRLTILCKLRGVQAELIKHGLAVDVEGGHQQTRPEATLPRTKIQGF
jgi:hypothetical protein